MATERRLIVLDDVIAVLNSEGITKNMRVHRKVVALPTVDAMEVVHGQWIKRPDERICPFCNDRYSYFGGKEKNFCSNCGAKMDGDGNA